MNTNLEIFDAHAHLAPGDAARKRLLDTMNQEGIVHAIVVPGGTVSPDLVSLQTIEGGGINQSINNKEILESCYKSNSRLFPFFFANPHNSYNEYSSQGYNYYGLKLGPAIHGIPFYDNRVKALISLAAKFEHPVYTHCINHQGMQVKDLVKLSTEFEDVSFILGHAGTINLDLNAINLIKNYKNIYFETSGGFTFVIKEAINRLGEERVIFGTEYPLEHPRPEIEKYLVLDLEESLWRKVTNTNIRNLIKWRD